MYMKHSLLKVSDIHNCLFRHRSLGTVRRVARVAGERMSGEEDEVWETVCVEEY